MAPLEGDKPIASVTGAEGNPPEGSQAPPGAIEPPALLTYRRGDRFIRKSPRHGLPRTPPKKRTLPPTPAEEEQAARMAAAGATKKMIGDRLRMTWEQVNAILSTPHVQEFMAQCREATRAITLAGIQQTQTKAMGWLEKTVDDADHRAFDAVSRGVFSLEKTAASASGETRPNVQVAVVNQQTESDEIKALIRALAIQSE